MELCLWKFSAYGFHTIEHLPIVIFDVSWNAERVSLSQGESHPSTLIVGPYWGDLYCRSKNFWPGTTWAASVFLLFTLNTVSHVGRFSSTRGTYFMWSMLGDAPSKRCPSGYPEQHLPWPMDWSWRIQLCTLAYLTWIVLSASCGTT
jgi:hypothetical protein